MKRPLWNGRRAQRAQWLADARTLALYERVLGPVGPYAAAVLRARKDARRQARTVRP